MDQYCFPSYLANPAMMAIPLYSRPAYPVQSVSTVIPTSYTPFQQASSISGGSSHLSLLHLQQQQQSSRAEVVARTVHLRCLPPVMKQRELADVFDRCGPYLRVRICGNAATHQKWVYGFVEFATTEAAAAMLTHSGMELSNGVDKPPLRLKCSPSKQPILDCMAYDADVVGGTPCGFGRGYLAECTLNDALLVVGTNNVATPPAVFVPVGLTNTASRMLTSPIDSGCDCTGLTCSGSCQRRRAQEHSVGDADGGGSVTAQTSVTAVSSCDVPYEAGVSFVGPTKAVKLSSPAPAHALAVPLEALKSTSFTQLVSVNRIGNLKELDVMQQLATAFQGLRTTAAAGEGQLDGPTIVRRAETMTLDVLMRASHLSSDARIQDVLCDVAELLSFLDANAAVTGGAAQTGSGDCTAALPQHVTQLRMLANLIGALLCLLRRSVADAVPYVEAVLVTFAQIPPSSLLLRVREREKNAFSTSPAPPSPEGLRVPAKAQQKGASGGALPAYAASNYMRAVSTRRGHLFSLTRGTVIDEDVTDALLELIDEGDDGDDGNAAKMAESKRSSTEASQPHNSCAHQTSADVSSFSSPSDESVACLHNTDMVDLQRQDVYFTGYVLNALVTIGLAMEEVQPALARGAYALANRRAIEVFGYPSHTLVKCLAVPSVNPHLLGELFQDAGSEGQLHDIAFFSRRFFESVNSTWVHVRDTRGTDGFYRLLPPNYIVPLF